MFDPSTGRWTSEDPIEFDAGDANLFRYVGNNATNATDPTGLEEVIPGLITGSGAYIDVSSSDKQVQGKLIARDVASYKDDKGVYIAYEGTNAKSTSFFQVLTTSVQWVSKKAGLVNALTPNYIEDGYYENSVGVMFHVSHPDHPFWNLDYNPLIYAAGYGGLILLCQLAYG